MIPVVNTLGNHLPGRTLSVLPDCSFIVRIYLSIIPTCSSAETVFNKHSTGLSSRQKTGYLPVLMLLDTLLFYTNSLLIPMNLLMLILFHHQLLELYQIQCALILMWSIWSDLRRKYPPWWLTFYILGYTNWNSIHFKWWFVLRTVLPLTPAMIGPKY